MRHRRIVYRVGHGRLRQHWSGRSLRGRRHRIGCRHRLSGRLGIVIHSRGSLHVREDRKNGYKRQFSKRRSKHSALPTYHLRVIVYERDRSRKRLQPVRFADSIGSLVDGMGNSRPVASGSHTLLLGNHDILRVHHIRNTILPIHVRSVQFGILDAGTRSKSLGILGELIVADLPFWIRTVGLSLLFTLSKLFGSKLMTEEIYLAWRFPFETKPTSFEDG